MKAEEEDGSKREHREQKIALETDAGWGARGKGANRRRMGGERKGGKQRKNSEISTFSTLSEA